MYENIYNKTQKTITTFVDEYNCQKCSVAFDCEWKVIQHYTKSHTYVKTVVCDDVFYFFDTKKAFDEFCSYENPGAKNIWYGPDWYVFSNTPDNDVYTYIPVSIYKIAREVWSKQLDKKLAELLYD